MIEESCRLTKPKRNRNGKPRRASYCKDFKEKPIADIRTFLQTPKKKAKQ